MNGTNTKKASQPSGQGGLLAARRPTPKPALVADSPAHDAGPRTSSRALRPIGSTRTTGETSTAALEGPNMSTSEFGELKELIFATIGVHVTPAKIPLLRGRLRGPMQRLGAHSFADYVKLVRERPSHEVLGELADAVTTNHTHFWREPIHFEILEKKVIPELALQARRSGSRVLRAWCAAASTGQEPYTLATIIMSALGNEYAQWDAGLLATDISARALDLALRGRYAADDVSTLPPVWQRLMLSANPDGTFQVRPNIAKEVTYRRLNLVGAPFRFKRPFDVVFCRNVMIYFDEPTRQDVVARLGEVIRPGGYLFVGLAESLGMPRWFEQISPSVYRRNEVKG